MKIICTKSELEDIVDLWCCNVDRLDENECDRNCKECFENYGIVFETFE